MVCKPEHDAKRKCRQVLKSRREGNFALLARVMDTFTEDGAEERQDDHIGPSSEWLHLNQIEPGHCAMVAKVEAGATEIERLKSMGVCVGRRLVLVRAGDPLILKVLGTRIGLSARLASNVLVLSCAGDAFGEV